MNKLTLALTLFFLITSLSESHESSPIKIEVNKNNSLTIISSRRKKTFSLKHQINGYAINCSKTRLMAWGTPASLSVEAPQSENISIIEIQESKLVKVLQIGRGLFSLNYLKDGVSAYIEFGYGEASISPANLLVHAEPNTQGHPEFETCKPFEGQRYSRWDVK